MIDLAILREKPELVADMLAKRRVKLDLEEILTVDKRRRELITKTQELKRERNVISERIAQAKKKGEDARKEIQRMREVSDKIAKADETIAEIEKDFLQLVAKIPNFFHETVPIGNDGMDNVEVETWGEHRKFDFKPLSQEELVVKDNLADLERAAKVAGSRFYYLRGDIVRLNFAILRFGLDYLKQRGYTLIQPPYMLRRDAISGAIIISDFEDVIYKIENEDLYLIGTAEHALAAMHMGEIFTSQELPKRYCGISPCFRKEAGAHGKDTKGVFRVHQFEKVEQFVFCRPEDSWREHETLLRNTKEFFQLLELPYRVVLLCTGDLGKVSAKTYDIECWFPGQDRYREVVSCSNCTDFQARSLSVKYRQKPHEEAKFVHTLNSTLVANPRAILAIMENNQERDGSFTIPKALVTYMGGQDRIVPEA
jgi:seryl-tRNA synthetase